MKNYKRWSINEKGNNLNLPVVAIFSSPWRDEGKFQEFQEFAKDIRLDMYLLILWDVFSDTKSKSRPERFKIVTAIGHYIKFNTRFFLYKKLGFLPQALNLGRFFLLISKIMKFE